MREECCLGDPGGYTFGVGPPNVPDGLSMSTINVFKLDDYRDRRRQRLRVAEALHGGDSGRGAVLGHLEALARLLGADRVATVWIDEYGPGLVHPHVVLDLLSDRPRRSFAAEPLRKAWESGVPGGYEAPTGKEGAPPWSMSVALGSDGTRSWFVVADAVAPRPPLTGAQREDLMFLAGECSAVVLHRDLEALAAGNGADGAQQGRFAGWALLQDLEGRDPESQESKVISLRFVVGRLPRILVDEDLTLPLDRLRQQADRAREEVDGRLPEVDAGPEADLWHDVLDAFGAGDLPRLARDVVRLAEVAEAKGHVNGALDLYETGYEIAAAVTEVETAVDAARLAGRCLRRQSRWAEAHRQYDRARAVAEAAGRHDRVALVLDGVATIHRERGNLPKAREVLNEGLRRAEQSGEALPMARLRHGFMGLEHAVGNLEEAVVHGWAAVRLYDQPRDRGRGMASVAGLLQELGALEYAEDGWQLVLHYSDEKYYRLYALDALSHIWALRGNAPRFAQWAAQADALGWEDGPAHVKSEILLYRGLSLKALGRAEEARPWLERAMAFAEENKFGRNLFLAEAALSHLHEAEDQEPAASLGEATGPVLQELQGLRRELVPV